jgi:hypothetical protein
MQRIELLPSELIVRAVVWIEVASVQRLQFTTNHGRVLSINEDRGTSTTSFDATPPCDGYSLTFINGTCGTRINSMSFVWQPSPVAAPAYPSPLVVAAYWPGGPAADSMCHCP